MANGTTVRQVDSDIDAFGDAQGIFELDAKVTHSAVDLGVTKQQLNGTEITCLPIDFRRFGPVQRMGACPSSAFLGTKAG